MTATDLPAIRWPRRHLTVSLGPLGVRVDVRALVLSLLLITGTVVTTLVSLRLGDYVLSAREVLQALTSTEDTVQRTIVVEWRLPRALAAIVFGAALAVSGVVFQSLTRNPLASPDIIGFSTGSYSGALLVLLLTGGGYAEVAGGAIAGGVVTALVVYLLAYRRGMQGFRLIIVGIAISAMLGSVNAYLMLTARVEQAMQAAVWGAGSLAPVTRDSLAISGAIIAIVFIALADVLPAVRELELGDELATAHGVRSRVVWVVSVVLGVALTAVVTATCGPIAFVALAAPQIARRVVGGGGIPFATSALVGAFLVSAADVTAQHIIPGAVPVGLSTVVIGEAYLVWLVLRESRRRR